MIELAYLLRLFRLRKLEYDEVMRFNDKLITFCTRQFLHRPEHPLEQLSICNHVKAISRYAAGVGPEKGYIIPRDANGNLGQPTDFVPNAHAAGLKVHPYTFRAENVFLPTNLRNGDSQAELGNIEADIEAFLDAGIDGLFIDQPDIAVRLRQQQN